MAQGRRGREPGFHARGANKTSLGICVVGNNTDPEERWVDNQLASLEQVLEVWLQMFPGSKIAGHCDVGTTATVCPGVEIRKFFPDFPAVETRARG